MADEETCECWGCRSPKILHKTGVPHFLSDCYALWHSIPVVTKHLSGRWFVFKDAPAVTVAMWASHDVTDDVTDDVTESFQQLVQQAREELKTREVRHARK